MAHLSASNESDHPNDARGSDTGGSLIRVPASAQQDPGSLQRCPVCGRPYTAEDQSLLAPQPEAAPGRAETPEQPEAPGGRKVMRCPSCGTYSVGSLDAQEET